MTKHTGDCSIYRLGCVICDCGYLRYLISTGRADDGIWEAWGKHLAAVAASCDPIVCSVDMKKPSETI